MSVNISLNKFINLLVFLFPICHLTLRGWTNVFSFLIFLALFICFCTLKDSYKSRLGKRDWTIFFLFSVWILAEAIVAIARQDVVWSDLDAPSRALLAGGVFVLLRKMRFDLKLDYLAAGCATGIVLSALLVFLDRESWWGSRAATYFVDPITLGVQAVGMMSIVFGFLDFKKDQSKYFLIFVTAFCFVLVCILCVLTSARTSWLMLIVIAMFVIANLIRVNTKVSILVSMIAIVSAVATYQLSPAVQGRVDGTLSNISAYVNYMGSSDNQTFDGPSPNETSVGIRLMLMKLDIELFKRSPWLGSRDNKVPPFEELRGAIPKLTRVHTDMKNLAGSHTELGQAATTKGVFGLLAFCATFLAPLGYFIYLFKKNNNVDFWTKSAGLLFVVSFFGSSFFIQVVNLKMTATFYAFVVSIFLSLFLTNFDGKARLSNVTQS
jgi:hypothetical protein